MPWQPTKPAGILSSRNALKPQNNFAPTAMAGRQKQKSGNRGCRSERGLTENRTRI